MFFQTTENLTHNPQNCPDDVRNGNSAYSADGSRRIQILFSELQTAGVKLFIEDGRLAFDAPGDAMTDELLARVRAERDGLLALLTGLSVPAADPEAPPLVCVVSILPVGAARGCRAGLAVLPLQVAGLGLDCWRFNRAGGC